jgi:hypothetical protein
MRAPITILILTLAGCDKSQEPVPNNAPPPANAITGSPKLNGSVTFQLADAELRHAESPEAFEIPSAAERKSLNVGDGVKLVFEITDGSRTEVERMWVEVTGRKEDSFEGLLNNDPYCTDELKSGEPVTFEPRHVIQIKRANESDAGE